MSNPRGGGLSVAGGGLRVGSVVGGGVVEVVGAGIVATGLLAESDAGGALGLGAVLVAEGFGVGWLDTRLQLAKTPAATTDNRIRTSTGRFIGASP